MIRRKHQARVRHALRIVFVTLLLNLIFPAAHVHAVDNPISPISLQTIRAGQLSDVTAPTPEPVQPVEVVRPSLPTIADKPVVVTQRMTVRATAYSSTRDQTDASPFVTASGTRVRDGIIAINGLKFGTKVR